MNHPSLFFALLAVVILSQEMTPRERHVFGWVSTILAIVFLIKEGA